MESVFQDNENLITTGTGIAAILSPYQSGVLVFTDKKPGSVTSHQMKSMAVPLAPSIEID